MIDYINEISVADYNALRVAVGWQAIKANRAQIGLNNSAYLVAARLDDGRVIATARVISDGGYVMYIADVIVHPEYQGQSIGKTMMQKIMDYINSTLEEDFAAYACLMAAKGKEPFYNKFGFIKRPNETFGAGMFQLISTKKGEDKDE